MVKKKKAIMVKKEEKKEKNRKQQQQQQQKKTTVYKKKLIDSYRFMSISLSNLLDNLCEINKKECKACMERKKNLAAEKDAPG